MSKIKCDPRNVRIHDARNQQAIFDSHGDILLFGLRSQRNPFLEAVNRRKNVGCEKNLRKMKKIE